MCFYQFDMNDDLAHNLRIRIINNLKFTVNHNTVVTSIEWKDMEVAMSKLNKLEKIRQLRII